MQEFIKKNFPGVQEIKEDKDAVEVIFENGNSLNFKPTRSREYDWKVQVTSVVTRKEEQTIIE